MKKFLWMFFAVLIVAGLAACMPAASGGGGTVTIGDEVVQTQAAAPAESGGNAGANGAVPEASPGGLFSMMWPILLMLPVMYFLLIRPQRKQAKAAKEMQESLRVGENVMTSSGFFGKIVGVGTDAFLVEFGQDRGFKVWVRKADIAGVRSPVMTPPPKSDEAVNDKKK